MVAILWLAALAVPPRSAGAILFLILFTVTLPCSVVGFWNATIGFLIVSGSRDPVTVVNPVAANGGGDEPITASTAILMCIRNEPPDRVARNLRPLLGGLAAARVAHRFHIYVLSDTGDREIIAAEDARLTAFAAKWRDAVEITYRRRSTSAGFKVGNIRDFCDR